MTKSKSTKTRSFISANIRQSRLASERVTSPPARLSAEARQVQIKAEAKSQFTVSLNDPKSPSELQLQINYRVELVLQDTNNSLASYEATHTSLFGIEASSGISDWTKTPIETYAPYMSITQHLAAIRAEGTLASMGFRGVNIPRSFTLVSDPNVETPDDMATKPRRTKRRATKAKVKRS